MIENLQEIFEQISLFDYLYFLITFLSVIRSTIKGFVLSLLSVSKWVLAYIITLIIFPKVKPHALGIIDNEYVLDILLGLTIFIIVLFIILLINKGIGKVVTYSGIGKIDKIFGFLFGFLKGYAISVCIFISIDIVYNHNKWSINLKESFFFPWVENGSKYLIKEFPDQKKYEDAKDKVKEL